MSTYFRLGFVSLLGLVHCVGDDPEMPSIAARDAGKPSIDGAVFSQDAGASPKEAEAGPLDPCEGNASACPTGIRSANLEFWLRADMNVDCASGRVALWKDMSGKQHNASVVAGGAGPRCGTTTLGGRPSLEFKRTALAAGQPLDTDVLAVDFSPLRNKANTVFVVQKRDSDDTMATFSAPASNTGGLFFVCPGAGQPNTFFTLFYTQSADAGVDILNETVCAGARRQVPLGQRQPELLVASRTEAGALKLYRNGVELVGGQPGNMVKWDHANASDGVIGRSSIRYPGTNNTDDRFNGEIAEIVIYSAELNDAERGLLTNTLKVRWGLSF